MVVLITGASHTGKTALAQRLLEKCSIDLMEKATQVDGYE